MLGILGTVWRILAKNITIATALDATMDGPRLGGLATEKAVRKLVFRCWSLQRWGWRGICFDAIAMWSCAIAVRTIRCRGFALSEVASGLASTYSRTTRTGPAKQQAAVQLGGDGTPPWQVCMLSASPLGLLLDGSSAGGLPSPVNLPPANRPRVSDFPEVGKQNSAVSPSRDLRICFLLPGTYVTYIRK